MMLGLASNSIRPTVEIMMRNAELDTYMDVMLSNEDVSSPKPDPEIYINVMDRLSVDPAECLIVEDNENGIKAAKASGAHVLVVKSVLEANYQNLERKIKLLNSSTES
jgi:HAD superfamily hydrolase (TIGR01509 family)